MRLWFAWQLALSLGERFLWLKRAAATRQKHPPSAELCFFNCCENMAFGPIGILVCKEFQVFKDYYGLANVLKEIQREKTSGNLYDGSFTNRPCQPSLPNKPTVPVDQKLDCSVRCGFCNGEYRLKNPYSGKIRCPVLRSYTCSICNATGDKAHTRKYCPRQYCHSKNYKRAWGTVGSEEALETCSSQEETLNFTRGFSSDTETI